MFKLALVMTVGMSTAFVVGGRGALEMQGKSVVSAKKQTPVKKGPVVTWPPRSEDMVTVSGKIDFGKRETVPIYKVPPGRTLALTKVILSLPTGFPPDLLQRLGGKDLARVESWMFEKDEGSLLTFSACCVPVRFPAGSLVVLRGQSVVHLFPGWLLTEGQYHLRGYLTDQ